MNLAPRTSTILPAPPVRSSRWRVGFRIFRWVNYVAALIAILLFFHKPPSPVLATSPTPVTPPQAQAQVEEKLQLAEQGAGTGQPAALNLTESELNAFLASRLNIAPEAQADSAGPSQQHIEEVRSAVRDVKVQLEGDSLHAYVVIDFHGADLFLRLDGKLAAVDGYVRFEPVGGKIGSLPLPQSALQSAMQRVMNKPENREALKLPPNVSNVSIQNGELVITYR